MQPQRLVYCGSGDRAGHGPPARGDDGRVGAVRAVADDVAGAGDPQVEHWSAGEADAGLGAIEPDQRPRQPGQPGDPSCHRLRAELAAGAIPFTCQGNLNGLAIEGGETLGFELAAGLSAAGVALEYLSPIGVVRAGAAVRLNRLSGTGTPGAALENPDPGQRLAFHITVGEAF